MFWFTKNTFKVIIKYCKGCAEVLLRIGSRSFIFPLYSLYFRAPVISCLLKLNQDVSKLPKEVSHPDIHTVSILHAVYLRCSKSLMFLSEVFHVEDYLVNSSTYSVKENILSFLNPVFSENKPRFSKSFAIAEAVGNVIESMDSISLIVTKG